MYSFKLDLMSSYICQEKLKYNKIIALYKRKQVCNQPERTNSLNKIISILFCYTFISR